MPLSCTHIIYMCNICYSGNLFSQYNSVYVYSLLYDLVSSKCSRDNKHKYPIFLSPPSPTLVCPVCTIFIQCQDIHSPPFFPVSLFPLCFASRMEGMRGKGGRGGEEAKAKYKNKHKHFSRPGFIRSP